MKYDDIVVKWKEYVNEEQDVVTVPFDEEDDDKMIEEEYDYNTDNDPNA